jgi:hypothetical protein
MLTENYPIKLIFLTVIILGVLILPPYLNAAAQSPPPTPTPLPDPYEDLLLGSKNVPQSAWRPSLYPAPFALSPHDHFYFNRPVGVDEVNWPLPSYRYGGSFFAPDITHTGVDIVTPIGTAVVAAAPGQVLWAGVGLLNGDDSEDDPYGYAIAIEHEFGWKNETLYTVYAHLSEIKVTKGQYINTGEIIGLSGDTGFTTGPHLHFEIRLGSNNFYRTLNPELWLTPPQGYGLIVGKLISLDGQLLVAQEVVITNTSTQKEWRGKSYSSIFTVNGDPFYDENFVISDLPSGNYDIQILYNGYYYKTNIDVDPGRITYFHFLGQWGFRDYKPRAAAPSNIQPFLED